ncbi:MAG: sigma-54 dependent transcriptional regulator [Phycisphaeraceae bacterium]
MTDKTRILIVDDDPIVAESLAEALERDGYTTATACNGEEALALINQTPAGEPAERFGVVITDVNMPRCDGLELIRRLRKNHDAITPIVITGFGKIEQAVEAVKLGAIDYLTKPVVDEELSIAVNKAVRQHVLLAENRNLKSQLLERYGMDNLVGADYRMQKVYDLVEAVAQSKSTALVEGESGTGKSMVARAIHARSNRGSGPLVTFACGAIPETLLESELFGHVKGAFTGADSDKPGKILGANGGSLFIDEINSATPALQLKLLRVLQERQFEPVGSTKTVSVDVRFILATNQSLQELVAAGTFREDLYYRINVVTIRMPPLRDRAGDIGLLAEHFLAKYAQEMGKDRSLSDDALAALRLYGWPGNVRELENAIERAMVLSRRPVIGVEDLPETVQHAAGAALPGSNGHDHGAAKPAVNGHDIPALAHGWTPMPLQQALLEPERRILLAALRANAWNRQETARQLDINRTTLYKKIKQFDLEGLE